MKKKYTTLTILLLIMVMFPIAAPATIVSAKTSSSVQSYSEYHSPEQSKLYNYLCSSINRKSINEKAIRLHYGHRSNTCVYFTSEALRRVNVKIPYGTANIRQFIRELKKRNWVKSYSISSVKPGDLVFAGKNGAITHVYIFMSWSNNKNGIANIADNQSHIFGTVYHTRYVFKSDPKHDTDPAIFIMYKSSSKIAD